MASKALECDVCYNFYSEEFCPRILPCSHTFCGPCIDEIITTQRKTCPTCREGFTATSAEELMINRIALDVVKQPSTINVKPKTLSKGPKGSLVEWKKFTKEILDDMEGVFAATETLNEIKDGLLDTKKEIGRFKEKLRDIELSIDKILGKISKSHDQLEAATDLTLTEPLYNAQENVKKIKELLQRNQRERDDTKKEICKMKERLKNLAEDMEISAEKVIEGKPRNQDLSSSVEIGYLPRPQMYEHEALMNTYPRKLNTKGALKKLASRDGYSPGFRLQNTVNLHPLDRFNWSEEEYSPAASNLRVTFSTMNN